MGETVQHESYKGISICSSPFEVSRQGQTLWKVRLDIGLPTSSSSSMPEYLNDRLVFLTSTEAHLAGLEWGHRIVDLAERSGQIPSPKLAADLLGP